MTNSAAASVAEIRDRLWLAIAERRLRPGTRLKEEELAEIFGSTRARVRQALSLLERDRLVTLIPNRGGFVAEPTIEEARDVFFARRLIEVGLLERLCQKATEADLADLHDHLAQEREAQAEGDLATIVRLSGGFHILIAELAGSVYLQDVMRDLVSRTSLISTMYGPRHQHDCGPDEHAEIVRCIAARDAAGALHAMRHHLSHVEETMDLSGGQLPSHDLRQLLG